MKHLAIWIPVLVGWIAFAPGLGAGFVHDDSLQILRNPMLRDLSRLPELWTSGVWAGVGSGSSWYRPLLTTSYALEYAAFGFSPVAMHAVSLLLYGAVVGLGTRLVLALESPRAAVTALATGLLFAPHPLNVEPAVWLSGRMDLLAAAGGLGALLLHQRGTYAAAAAALTLGLFGKESAIGFLPALLALDVVRGAGFGGRELAHRYGWVALGCVLYLGLRAAALGSVEAGLSALPTAQAWLGALGQGVTRVLWPVAPSIAPPAPGGVHFALGLGAGGMLCVAVALALRARSAALVPLVLGASQLALAATAATRIGELADRYLLLVVLSGAWLLGRALAHARFGPAAAVAAAVALGIGAGGHARAFHSELALWSDAARKNPRSFRAVLNLAAAHLEAGQPEAALPWLARATALQPDDPQLAIDRAVAAEQLGRSDEARLLLEELLAREPGNPSAHLRLGHLALGRAEPLQAARHYESALEAEPRHAEAWAGLGVARYQQGQPGPAREALERALRLDPEVQNAAQLRALVDRLQAY